MLLDTAHARLDLRRDQFVRLTDACGMRIDCLRGSVWITVDGELRDVVLSSDESFVVDSRAPVLVHAIHEPTAVALQAREPAHDARHAPGRHGWIVPLSPAAATVQ